MRRKIEKVHEDKRWFTWWWDETHDMLDEDDQQNRFQFDFSPVLDSNLSRWNFCGFQSIEESKISKAYEEESTKEFRYCRARIEEYSGEVL